MILRAKTLGYSKSEGLDFEERVRRRKKSKVANALGYNVRWDEKQLHFLNKKLEDWNKKEPIREEY